MRSDYIRQTKKYYDALTRDDICSCDYCRNYCKEVRDSYPALAEYLQKKGIDIEKPFEIWPLDPDADETILYPAVQYIVMGKEAMFCETDISGVRIGIADSHPMTDISADHYVIELSPVKLKWSV